MEVVQQCAHYCKFGSCNVTLEDMQSVWDSYPRRNMWCSPYFYAWQPTMSMFLDPRYHRLNECQFVCLDNKWIISACVVRDIAFSETSCIILFHRCTQAKRYHISTGPSIKLNLLPIYLRFNNLKGKCTSFINNTL